MITSVIALSFVVKFYNNYDGSSYIYWQAGTPAVDNASDGDGIYGCQRSVGPISASPWAY